MSATPIPADKVASSVVAAMPKVYVKYPSRRLYSEEKSGYVTLDDIAEDVLRGEAVRVIQKSTGLDITYAVLLDVFVMLERRTPTLGVDEMKLLIRENRPTT